MPDFGGAVILGETITISPDQEYIAEIIKDYDPHLELQYIPPDSLFPGQKPFRVVHRPPGKPEYIVFYADVCDQRILERLWTHDNARTNVLTDQEAREAATKALAYKRWMEENEDASNQFAHAMASPLNVYKYHGSDGALKTIRN